MASPGRPGRNTRARSFRQLRRFHHGFNSDKVFGTHNSPECDARGAPSRSHNNHRAAEARQQNLTNIVRISSQEWRTWSTRGPSAARLIGSNPPKMVSTTKIKDLNKKEAGNGKASVDPVSWMRLASRGSG